MRYSGTFAEFTRDMKASSLEDAFIRIVEGTAA
jgi:hypothetical protein